MVVHPVRAGRGPGGHDPATPRRARNAKEATRRAIIAAALKLLAETSFSGLSLREVTREAGIVPAAFYRHSRIHGGPSAGPDRRIVPFAARDPPGGAHRSADPTRVIDSTVEILTASVTQQREHWRFISRERSSGVTVLRYAIRTEIRLITSELATDLARFPDLRDWSTEDLNILASLFVNSMIIIAESLEDAGDAAAVQEINRIATKQLG